MSSRTTAVWAWRIAAVALLSILTASVIWQASIVIDGTRYFFLDDDQMVSMRYARNLAEGLGPVWNAGERVEGYTSPGWMAVMAVVHWLGAGDARAAVYVKLLNWALAIAILLLSERLLTLLRPDATAAAVGTLLLSLALCADVLFWSTNGFETTLLTTLVLASLVILVRDARKRHVSPLAAVLIGAIPIARSDGWLLMTALLATTAGLSGLRPLLRQLPLAALLPFAHLLWRYSYYGDWLPNTYYLRVVGADNLTWRGFGYIKAFLLTYAAAGIAAAGWWLWMERGQRSLRWLLAPMVGLIVQVALVGPDMFGHHRFLAPAVPLLLVLAVTGILLASGASVRARALMLAMLLVATTVSAGVTGRQDIGALVSTNGFPFEAAVTAHLIRHHTSESASVAVVAAGVVPYFSRRYCIDLLGKTDRRTARLEFRPGAPIGHGKFDVEAALGRAPDLLVPHWINEWARDAGAMIRLYGPDPATDLRTAIAVSLTFNQRYRPHPINVPFLQRHHAVFVRDTSPERGRIAAWREPRVSH
jgi:arabinofuranosyltransferase